SYFHKDPVSGASCFIPPPPPKPTAVIIGAKVYCPSPDSAEWSKDPVRGKRIDNRRIDSIVISRDTTTLIALKCNPVPSALIRFFVRPTKRRGGRDGAT